MFIAQLFYSDYSVDSNKFLIDFLIHPPLPQGHGRDFDGGGQINMDSDKVRNWGIAEVRKLQRVPLVQTVTSRR